MSTPAPCGRTTNLVALKFISAAYGRTLYGCEGSPSNFSTDSSPISYSESSITRLPRICLSPDARNRATSSVMSSITSFGSPPPRSTRSPSRVSPSSRPRIAIAVLQR